MNVYVFGNEDVHDDAAALKAADYLKQRVTNIHFIPVQPNDDVPFAGEGHVVIMDTMTGIETIAVVDEKKIDSLILPPRSTVHDFDLGFQLAYLKKIGKLKKVTIICIPQKKEIDYNSLHSILRKLVAQDMHGS